MTPEILTESAAIGQIRSSLLTVQEGLARGPKRSAASRKLAWLSIAQEASNRAAAIVVEKQRASRQTTTALPLNGGAE